MLAAAKPNENSDTRLILSHNQFLATDPDLGLSHSGSDLGLQLQQIAAPYHQPSHSIILN